MTRIDTDVAADFLARCFAPGDTVALLIRRDNPLFVLQRILPLERALAPRYLGWLAHETCSITGEMLISVAGRVAKAYAAETEGVYRPAWTIEDVAQNLPKIRDTDDSWIFSVTPQGHIDHLLRSFEMARQG